MSQSLGEALLNWYQEHARDLPWRGTDDPYCVLVSEVMLQQTRVETVRPYYQRWMERFPGVADLAESSLDEVLQLWEGLGYYRRAHNLHAAAQRIQEQYDGQVPTEPRLLQELPGVGEYTASAVAAIAFDRDQIALDGNLKRVLARLHAVQAPVDRPSTVRDLKNLALEMMPAGRAADFNQALMDLGAQICISGTPLCGECPLQSGCRAFQGGIQAELPNRRAKMAIPRVERVAVVVHKRGRVLVGRRPADAMLAGLWEFPRFEVGRERAHGTGNIVPWVEENLGLRVQVQEQFGQFTHAYSHFQVAERAYRCRWLDGHPRSAGHQAIKWARVKELDSLPMGKLARATATAWRASFQ